VADVPPTGVLKVKWTGAPVDPLWSHCCVGATTLLLLWYTGSSDTVPEPGADTLTVWSHCSKAVPFGLLARSMSPVSAEPPGFWSRFQVATLAYAGLTLYGGDLKAPSMNQLYAKSVAKTRPPALVYAPSWFQLSSLFSS
jgi:hypothetical protein